MAADTEFLTEVDSKLAFQTKWRRVMSISYFTATALALTCSSAATVVAATGEALWGSVLAAAATVLFGLEDASSPGKVVSSPDDRRATGGPEARRPVRGTGSGGGCSAHG